MRKSDDSSYTRSLVQDCGMEAMEARNVTEIVNSHRLQSYSQRGMISAYLPAKGRFPGTLTNPDLRWKVREQGSHLV